MYKPHLRKMPRLWRIDLENEHNTEYVGVVTASDRRDAIENACEKFDVVDPQKKRQLTARQL
jgi:hypothetical protein